MRALLFIAFFFVAALHVSLSDQINIKKRISTGVDGAAGENLDYVLLSIRFYNQAQRCGGILVHPQYVLTTATCVIDPVEGVATIVNATFPQLLKNNLIQKSKILIHESFSPATYANNVALVKLLTATVPDNKTLAVAKFATDNTTDLYTDQLLRMCGFGTTANYFTLPTKLKCTDLFVHPAADCGQLPNTLCTYWDDRENNACANDYGGALYKYSYNGTRITQTVVGIASFSPDYRRNTPCKGGQKVVHTQTSFYLPWIVNTIVRNL